MLEAHAACGQVIDEVIHKGAHRVRRKVYQLHEVVIIHVDAVGNATARLGVHVRANAGVDVAWWLEE